MADSLRRRGMKLEKLAPAEKMLEGAAALAEFAVFAGIIKESEKRAKAQEYALQELSLDAILERIEGSTIEPPRRDDVLL